VLPRVGDKNPQISLSWGVVLSQSTFHLVIFCYYVSGVQTGEARHFKFDMEIDCGAWGDDRLSPNVYCSGSRNLIRF